MFIGGSIALIVVGAVLRWGVTTSVTWADVPTVGLILLVAGVIGLVASLVQSALLSGRRQY